MDELNFFSYFSVYIEMHNGTLNHYQRNNKEMVPNHTNGTLLETEQHLPSNPINISPLILLTYPIYSNPTNISLCNPINISPLILPTYPLLSTYLL